MNLCCCYPSWKWIIFNKFIVKFCNDQSFSVYNKVANLYLSEPWNAFRKQLVIMFLWNAIIFYVGQIVKGICIGARKQFWSIIMIAKQLQFCEFKMYSRWLIKIWFTRSKLSFLNHQILYFLFDFVGMYVLICKHLFGGMWLKSKLCDHH